jgi:hypothetical protein
MTGKFRPDPRTMLGRYKQERLLVARTFEHEQTANENRQTTHNGERPAFGSRRLISAQVQTSHAWRARRAGS